MGLLSKAFSFVKKALGFDLLKKALDWLIDIDVDNGTRAIQVMREGSNNDIPVIYGEQLVGGIVVHKYVTDQSGGAKNDTLNLIVAFAEGEIESIDTLYFDDVPETDLKFKDNTICSDINRGLKVTFFWRCLLSELRVEC